MKTLLFVFLWLCSMQVALSQTPRLHQSETNLDQEFDPATLPQVARDRLARLHTGMKRSEVEADFDSDGGVLWGFRYFLRSFSVRDKGVVLELTFQPADMPDEVYADKNRAALWRREHRAARFPQPSDILREVGKPFLSHPIAD